MTANDKCKEKQTECDTRYFRREWSWKTIIIVVLGCIGIIYAAGSFVTKTEMSIETIKFDINNLQKINNDIDSLKQWLRK